MVKMLIYLLLPGSLRRNLVRGDSKGISGCFTLSKNDIVGALGLPLAIKLRYETPSSTIA